MADFSVFLLTYSGENWRYALYFNHTISIFIIKADRESRFSVSQRIVLFFSLIFILVLLSFTPDKE